MEKLFHPNKWFVAFCAALIGVFALLQYVVTMRLQDIAKVYAKDIFTWNWTPNHEHSTFVITDVHILKRGESEAIVKVEGNQIISTGVAGASDSSETETGKETDDQKGTAAGNGAAKQTDAGTGSGAAKQTGAGDGNNATAKQAGAGKRTETKCGATITLYKQNADWFLGKVELE